MQTSFFKQLIIATAVSMMFFISFTAQCQSSNDSVLYDTSFVGKLIAKDSLTIEHNFTRFGITFFYGVHHLKVGIINIQTRKIVDTAIVAYVYNMTSELKKYIRNFDLRIGKSYIIDAYRFNPCKSLDFPRIQGYCDQDGYFVPRSNTLIKKYQSILRIINAFEYDEKNQ